MVEYIGLDIGGTNIKIGAIDTNENLIFSYKEQTFDNVSIADDLYKKIVNLIKRVPDYKKAKAMGIGLPGSIDLNTNKIITLRNVSLLKDYPLMNKLSSEFKMPIYFENDGRIAALAEALKGRGKDKKTVLLLNISSTFNPDIIILGGGVINAKERFINEVIEKFRLKAHPLAKNTIIETKMFDEPGIVGAGLFAKQNFEKFNL